MCQLISMAAILSRTAGTPPPPGPYRSRRSGGTVVALRRGGGPLSPTPGCARDKLRGGGPARPIGTARFRSRESQCSRRGGRRVWCWCRGGGGGSEPGLNPGPGHYRPSRVPPGRWVQPPARGSLCIEGKPSQGQQSVINVLFGVGQGLP